MKEKKTILVRIKSDMKLLEKEIKKDTSKKWHLRRNSNEAL